MKYVVGTGWWANQAPLPPQRKSVGDEVIRSPLFHKMWYRSLSRSTRPEKIIIVDSNSPVAPPLDPDDARIEFVSLDRNYGHATTCDSRMCGWSRSVLLGVAYALCCDADYFVYVEQDVLLHGEGIIDYAIERMKHPFAFGSGQGTPQRLQQSFFVIERSGFLPLLEAFDRIPESDNVLSPESKFGRIHFDWLPRKMRNRWLRDRWHEATRRLWHDWLPFGYGRARPINWEDPYFYFQHGTLDEIRRYGDLTGIRLEDEEALAR